MFCVLETEKCINPKPQGCGVYLWRNAFFHPKQNLQKESMRKSLCICHNASTVHGICSSTTVLTTNPHFGTETDVKLINSNLQLCKWLIYSNILVRLINVHCIKTVVKAIILTGCKEISQKLEKVQHELPPLSRWAMFRFFLKQM